MIQINHTPNFAGVTVTGDYYDLDELYDALHEVVGEEGEYDAYDDARIRVLGVCYDLRHAKMGDREYHYLDHGVDEDKMKMMGIVGPTRNLYLSFNIIYPEMLFVTMALNNFIDIRKRKLKHPDWDEAIAVVRKFQATFIESLSDIISERRFNMMVNNMNAYSLDFSNYFTQYLDVLNIRYLEWDKDNRVQNISRIAKWLAEQGKEYQETKAAVTDTANRLGGHPSEYRLRGEYPDEVDW